MEADPAGESRTHRRVQRTRAAIEEAFVRLASDRGYAAVTMEDIAEEADVAKATLYAHYPNREALLTAAFERLTRELGKAVAYREGPWTEIRTGAMTAVYEHAAQLSDLYRVCLAEPTTRELYLEGFRAQMENNARRRLEAVGREPRVPIQIIATVFAGAHVALLDAWLAGRIEGTPIEMATLELQTLVAGLAWAHNLTLADLGLAEDADT